MDEALRSHFAQFSRAARARVRRLDPALFTLWAAVCTLVSARSFYGYMLKQTGGEWSAPLDDVFIHFDYARATALGHPFEWTVGNGYSSGNTSLSYPFVLAVGWWLGFTGRSLMVWAAIVAATSVFGTMLAARRLFVDFPRDDGGRLGSYLLPPVLLGVGALTWSFWSGMEVAVFLATWALALVAWWKLEEACARDRTTLLRRATWLGVCGVLLVTTRPEAAATLGVFGLAAASKRWRAHVPTAHGDAMRLLLVAGAPAALALALQAVANKLLTGEASANGAIVKLAINNPFMTGDEKLADWLFNARYAALRNLDYHFAHIEGEHLSELVPEGAPAPLVHLARTAWWAGAVPLALALLPLVFGRTRRIAVILWTQIVLWVVVVALNGQVRWQNERYVMPAVAWLLVLAALGVTTSARRFARAGLRRTLRPSAIATIACGALVAQVVGVLTRPVGAEPSFRLPWVLCIVLGALAYAVLVFRPLRIAIVFGALLFAYDHQIPKMRDQKWFFGRASRNIRDQHLTLGRYLRDLAPNRVLVGDAGAILYESNLPGLDIIGLGGFHRLPFARAGVHGLPATLELIERLPEADRPEVLAIFPTWWGILPVWFASDVLERFPVEGNVICGGYEHVVYKADWHLLGTGEQMRADAVEHGRVRMNVDVGDLVSERAAGYAFARPQNGWTDMRVLPDLADEQRDVFDGGRRIAVGRWERFRLASVEKGRDASLVLRTAVERDTRVRVRVGGKEAGVLDLVARDAWQEPVVPLPGALVKAGADVEIVVEGPGDFLDYHAWVVQ